MFGCRMEQLSANGNSKGHCCLSVERITAAHIRPNYSNKSEEDHDDHDDKARTSIFFLNLPTASRVPSSVSVGGVGEQD